LSQPVRHSDNRNMHMNSAKVKKKRQFRLRNSYRIVGITNSAPSLIPLGQRLVTVFVFV
jgi:hypothetical protein